VVAVLFLQKARTLDDLAGEETGFGDVLAGIVELRPDIEAERFRRLALRRDIFERVVPARDQMGDDGGIDLLLGGKIVIDIGFGQAGGLGDFGDFGDARAVAGFRWSMFRTFCVRIRKVEQLLRVFTAPG
jgi:hypothetical protein